MTEHEANMKFCEFIKSNFGFDPVPISSHSLSSIKGKRTAVFIHNEQQAEILGYDVFYGDGAPRHYIIAPYYGYEDDDGFEYYDCDPIAYLSSFDRLQDDYEEWCDEDEDEEHLIFSDISCYNSAYYVVTDCMSVINIDELI